MLGASRLRQSLVKLYKRPYSRNVNALSEVRDLNLYNGGESQPLGSASATSEGLLSDKLIAIKDNIVTKDGPSAASSLTLDQYYSPFDATVVKLLRESGASVKSALNMDEFGMGSHSQYSHRPVRSPYTRGGIPLSPGGSSGGSAVAVAVGECWAALGTDTGGSVRLPAAYTGVVGFKPSYGLLSRWGVIQYANSLDTVGILAQHTSTIRSVFASLNHFDPLDPTSLPVSVRRRISQPSSKTPRPLRIGIPLEYNIAELSQPVKQAYTSLLAALQSAGHTLHPVSLPSTRLALSAYYILAPAEASSNLAKYDGVRYGHRAAASVAAAGPTKIPVEASPAAPPPPPPRNLLYASTRGAAFGPEVQRRILLGAYSLSAAAKDNYFLQAQRVRRLVQREFDAVFARANPLLDERVEEDLRESSGDGERSEGGGGGGGEEAVVDVLLTPTAPTLPPTVDEVRRASPLESYMNDVFTVPASLAGLPAVSVPVLLGEEARKGMEETDVATVGMQVIGQFGDDDLVLDFAEKLEGLDFS